ncbi:uncharacterized protein LOC123518233 isoform X2 [Portunus trituberculatus]|uniref:uncharacterized protein LOC123518233 isoform X2 n=1 Tax=Portunus trituberculatus TaxID=210409 RepID=UPI001E1CC1BD|nr:uncharacterized protein LOC123518233 isoform X2 [Portunus trituberculatus]
MSHSWRGAVALPLTLLGLAALCQATSVHDYKCFKFQRSGIGTIEPNGDIILEVGSSYEAYCLFNPAKVQVDDVFFKTTGNDGRRLDHEVVNSSAIKVQVTHNEPTQYLLKCSAGGDIICRRSVFVGHKPEDVQNFTCVSMNWESLNCSWSVPENPVKVTYSLTDCPQRERQQNWCFWHGVDFVSGRQNWTIIFSAINNLTQDPVEFKHNVDLYASVIPGKASNFKVDALGPREVILKWNLPHPIDVFTDGKVTQEIKYRIKPFRNIDDYSPWKVIDTWEYAPKRFNRKTFNRTISDLKPFVEYEFCVRLHTGTGPIREEMWSEPALVVKRTKSTRPMVAPLTTPGMFEIEENKLQRDVYINWQTVDPLEENGPNFTYEVQMFDDSNGRRLRNPQSTERGFIKFRSLENTITYRVEITPMNDHGLPEDPNVKSVVIVPNKASLLDVPDYFKVIAYSGNDTTTYMARWQIPEVTLANTNIETVTLYWCKQTDYENRCQNKLRWEIISDPALGVKSLTGYDPSSRHIFGISVNTHNSSSGIKWSGCIATHGEQQPAIDEFNYTNVLSSEVKLKWDLECKAQAAQPIAFNISYCVLEKLAEKCAEPEKFIKVDGESTVQYTVRNLHAYRDYSFSIATISEELGLGKWSRNVRVKTKPAKPSAAPQNITVVSKGKTWIYLSWNPPPEPQQNGDIAMYDIWYKVKGLPSVPSYVKDNVLQYNFTSLDAFTEYQFDIFACTWVSNEAACGKHPASIEVKTKIGAPGKINSLQYDALWLKWDHDECNGPSCSYELQYTINDTSFTYNTAINISAVPIRDLNITCPVDQGYIPVKLRAVNTDEENQRLTGPQEDWKIPSPCQEPGLGIGIIVTIVFLCIITTLFILGIFTYGWEQVKTFMRNLKIKPNLPIGLAPQNQSPSKSKKKWYANMSLSKEAITTNSSSFKPSEKQDLIDPGNERQHRNFSGDSGTSVADPADSSGCSTGGDSVSSSGSDRIPPSSDSGTVQEETGFASEVRLRTAPPYVLQGLPDKVPSMKGYVSVGSVPNLAVSTTDGVSSLQQSNPSLGLEPLQEVPMGGRRTSTGYISMPTNESDGMSFPLEDLGNLVLPHERQPGDLLAYSRHYMPYKKASDFSPYSKAQSLPWLNTGYVAVSQAEDGGQAVPGAQGYVAVGDAMNLMKRQPSLPSLPMIVSKPLTTPDQDLPPGAYCKLGARGSPDPPPNSLGYVSATQHMPMPNALAMSPPVYKSPYVTCAMAESVVSPKKEPRKTTDYVALGDTPDGQWAHPIIHPMTPEETRDVLSAPVEGSRGRVMQPVRPNSSETNNNRGSNQFAPSGHSLSKQSSGYASGNVSQETLTFHDPLVMSPKKLLTRSYEPHSVVYSPHHKPSMV